MTGLLVVVVVLAVLVAGEAIALAVTLRSLRASRRQQAALEASFVEVRPSTSRAVTIAGNAVQALATSASRLRRGGFSELLVGSLDDLQTWAREDRAGIVRVAAPDGTVTVMFTDIEDSTSLNEQLGDAHWLKVLSAHEHVVTTEVRTAGGHIVKNQGDGFMVVFGEPGDAVTAAVAIERELSGARRGALHRTPIAVRIGLHAGAVTARSDDFFGHNVAIAARVAAQAEGGQILATDVVVRALPADAPPTSELGHRELKGVRDSVLVHVVDWRRRD